MKIAITARDNTVDAQVDPRFGRARYIIVHDLENGETETLVNETNMAAQQGAGVQTAKKVVQSGVSAVVTGHVGPKAFRALTSQGVKIYLADNMTVKESIESVKLGKLELAGGADVEGHW